MTRNHDNVVRLSRQDWAGLLGVFITLVVLMSSAYLRHDRLIIEVLTRQEIITDRIDRIEQQFDAQTQRRD